MKTPLIFEIKGNSLDDGPGIRTVVFFKGCPLSCVWCHNPEGIMPGFEHSFSAGGCVRCRSCVESCSNGAISYSETLVVAKDKCRQCFTCASVCPSGALEIVGKNLGLEQIAGQVLKDRPFFETSGGGVTLSGGEPTLYTDFCSRLLKNLKSNGIHTLLETCGFFDMPAFSEKMLPWLDAIYFDIKLFDQAEHKKHCGTSNETILENFRMLAGRSSLDLLPRVPLVPGITDSESNLASIAAFIAACGIRNVKLLPYNPLWPDKLRKFAKDTAEIAGPMRQFMKPGQMEKCKAVFRQAGVQPL